LARIPFANLVASGLGAREFCYRESPIDKDQECRYAEDCPTGRFVPLRFVSAERRRGAPVDKHWWHKGQTGASAVGVGTSSSQVTVLSLHAVCDTIPKYAVFYDSKTCILRVEDFCLLARWCRDNFDVITIEDLETSLQGPRRRRYRPLLITFDDALASTVDFAPAILRENGLSALMFVTTDWTDAQQTPFIFQMESILAQNLMIPLEIRIAGNGLAIRADSTSDPGRKMKEVWDFLFKIRFPPLKLRPEHVQLDGKTPDIQVIGEDRCFWFPATWSELAVPVNEGIFDIGSHMVSHTPLPWLSAAYTRREMRESRDLLEQRFDRTVRACAYPHGMWNESVAGLAAETYDWGFSTRPGALRSLSERHHAPRFHVRGENWQSIKYQVIASKLGLTNLRSHFVSSVRSINRTAAKLFRRVSNS